MLKILTAPRSKRNEPLVEKPFNLMPVIICLALVNTGFIQRNINFSLFNVNEHGTFCFLSKALLTKIAFMFDSF